MNKQTRKEARRMLADYVGQGVLSDNMVLLALQRAIMRAQLYEEYKASIQDCPENPAIKKIRAAVTGNNMDDSSVKIETLVRMINLMREESKRLFTIIRAVEPFDRELPVLEDPGYIDIVFDGPPSAISGRFVEVEDHDGHGIKVGEWVHRTDGYWVLRLPKPTP